MGYLNFMEVMGYEVFVDVVVDVGVDGIFIVDLLLEEVDDVVLLFMECNFDVVFLFLLIIIDDWICVISEYFFGYVYYVLFKGVIGVVKINVDEVVEWVEYIYKFMVLLVGVGFGIWDVEMVVVVGWVFDGVIVGSVLVDIIVRNQVDIE